MANRVTYSEVYEIFHYDTTKIASSEVTAVITTANAIVTAVCTSSVLSTAILKEIERWLAAHFLSVGLESRLVSQSAGGASDSYETNKTGMGLKLTRYGQQACVLDISGALSRLGEGAKEATMELMNPTVGD